MAKKGRPFTYQSETEQPVTISLRLPRELHTRLQSFIDRHKQSGVTISELVRDGLEWRLSADDPRDLDSTPPPGQDEVYYDNTADNVLAQLQADNTHFRQEMRALFASQEAQIQAVMQSIATAGNNGLYNSNTARVPENPVLPATPVPGGNDEQRETITASPENNYYEQIETVPDQSNTVIQAAEPKHRGRKPVLRPGILALLDEHPEGLTAAELKVYLKTEKPIGDTLAGMARDGLLVKQGKGQGLRYQLATR